MNVFSSLKIVVPFCALLSANLLTASPATLPEVRLPPMSKAPLVKDRPIDPEEWQGAARMERLNAGGPKLAEPDVTFWVGATRQALYVAMRSELPPDGRLLTKANPLPGQGNPLVSNDDGIEIYLVPNPEAPASEQRIYQGIFNARGAGYSQLFTGSGGAAWVPNWTIGNHVDKAAWDFTLTIPWSDFGLERLPETTTSMGIRVVRNFKRTLPPRQAQWSPSGGAFTSLNTLAKITWDPTAPVVQLLSLQDGRDGRVNIVYRLYQPGSSARKLLIETTMKPTDSAPTLTRKEITLEAGQTLDVPTGSSAALAGESITTDLRVSDSNSGQTYYRRGFTWQLDRPNTIWREDHAADRLLFQYAYYPSLGLIHAELDGTSLANPPAGKESAKLTLRRAGSEQAITTTTFPPFHEGKSELRGWKVPPLEEGEYELTASIADGEPLKGRFLRKHFLWEDNGYGRSDAVVPPFTPLQADGNRVSAVLRNHQINGTGLWEQVEAAGQTLLKAPMWLEIVTNEGKSLKATGSYRLLERKDHRIRSEARWNAGPVNGTTTSTWDYDGTMRSIITLDKIDEPIRRMTLHIPLDETIATLFHTCTDGIRFNHAGRIPAGEGIIWKSSQAARNSIIGSFVPYLWAGGPLRGLSVFSDSDKGWITSDGQPTQEIVRTGNGSLELRLHLVAREAQWEKPRFIEIGFLATPIKPMPEGWRLWTVGGSGKARAEGQLHQPFFGSCPYWGTVSNYQDIYPRDEDFTYYEELVKARETGRENPEFIARWLKGYQLTGTPEQQEKRRAFYERHVGHAFRVIKNGSRHILPYTNPRGARFDTPEGKTFLNEWHREAFPQREWGYGSGHSYNVDPVASYRDYHAWYWRKMLTTFADSIYWDNIFMQSSFSPANPAAYVHESGRIQPAASLWNMREVVRRGMVSVHELGMPNRNMVHMTNTAIAPVLSFARSMLTWEDRGGDSDFQERFQRDYLLVEAIGRQFGTMPIALTSHIRGNDPEKLQRAYRTAAGVLLTHEIKPLSRKPSRIPGKSDPFWDNYDRLVEFGYGQQDVTVYNDWSEAFPLEVEGETSTLLLVGKGRALIVLCDWGTPGPRRVTLGKDLLQHLPGSLTAYQLEDGEPFPVEEGQITVPLKRHDFTLLLLEATP